MYFWCVQLGPKETHNAFSCAVRLFCSRVTAPCVIAGLDTDAAKPGPPVALTIYKHTNQGELLHLSALYCDRSLHNSVQTLLMEHLKQYSATKAVKALPFAQDTVRPRYSPCRAVWRRDARAPRLSDWWWRILTVPVKQTECAYWNLTERYGTAWPGYEYPAVSQQLSSSNSNK